MLFQTLSKILKNRPKHTQNDIIMLGRRSEKSWAERSPNVKLGLIIMKV